MSYAYISLLYPNKDGIVSYLDGALLVALGLRRQNVKHKIICMITPDIKQDVIDILKIVYDEIMVIDYISPTKGIIISSDIFASDKINTEMVNVFTKLHIFDKTKFNYDKIVFIDNDFIPIKKYDELFNLETPAGWPEQIYELNVGIMDGHYTRIWDVWKDIKHGDLISNDITDVYKKGGTDINAGLLVISPDTNKFNFFIDELKKNPSEWCKGTIGVDGKHTNYILEQSYLTQHFSGQWKMIDGKYCSWGKPSGLDINGIHMAGLRYEINKTWKHYKSWMLQIPCDDGMNITTNKLVLWAFENYPSLKNIIFNNIKFYIYGKIVDIKTISKFEIDILNETQQKIINYLI